MNRFHSITDGDNELGRELIMLLMKTMNRTITTLRQEPVGSAAFRAGAHELKGAADNLGLVSIANQAKMLEALAEGAEKAAALAELNAMQAALQQRAAQEGLA